MTKIHIQEVIVFAWETYKKNWKFLLFALIAAWVVSGILNSISNSIARDSFPLLLVLRFIGYIVNSVFILGLFQISLHLVDKKGVTYKDLYLSYPKVFIYVIASLLYIGMVLGGLLLLVVPGIYLGIKYYFYPYFIVDKNQGVFESLKHSSKITKGNMTNLFLLGLLTFIFIIVGFLTLGLGLFVAIPVGMLAYAHVYRKLSS